MKKLTISKLILAAATVSSCGLAVAQSDWRPMRQIIFDSERLHSTGSDADRAIMEALWAKDLKEHRVGLPVFTLIGDADIAGQRVVFSLLDTAGSERCDLAGEDPKSASGYNTLCTMLVTRWPSTGQAPSEIQGQCMLSYSDNQARNRMEYRVDKMQVHFRTIENGKVVPECNRLLKLQ